MANSAAYASTPRVGLATASVGDISRTAPTQVATVFTAGSSGSRIDSIALEGQNTTTASMLRLFLHNGSTYYLWKEVPTQAITPSATTPSFNAYLNSQTNPEILPLILPTNYSLRATVNDTQIVANASLAGVCASQSISASAYALLNGAIYGTAGVGVAASTTAIATAATVSSSFYTLTTIPYVFSTPSQVSLTSTGNQSAITFTVRGYDATGASQSETITGPNNTTVYGTKVWSVVTSVYSSASMTGTTSVGYSSVAVLPAATTIQMTSAATSNSGVTYTIIGTSATGATITEALVGPGINTVVTSVNSYKTITSIQANANASTALTVGNPNILSGINIAAIGGDF